MGFAGRGERMMAARASAPGKIILVGEHAVVYGQPAIAVPLAAVQATVSAEPGEPGAGLLLRAADLGETLRADAIAEGDRLYDALVFPARLALEALGEPVPDMTLVVRSTIPVASGLGSGAAIAAAIIRAVCGAFGVTLPRERLNALVYEVERRHHGTPSGIDNTVIVYEQPVYFVRGAPLETFRIARPFTLLVADSGQPSPTRVAVQDVRTLYEQDRERYGAALAAIGAITRRARQAIETGQVDTLGALMRENQALLRELSVSSPALDRLCAAATEAGAWGAKLSGGGRGGNLIALTAADRVGAVSEALYAAGAVRVIATTVGAQD